MLQLSYLITIGIAISSIYLSSRYGAARSNLGKDSSTVEELTQEYKDLEKSLRKREEILRSLYIKLEKLDDNSDYNYKLGIEKKLLMELDDIELNLQNAEARLANLDDIKNEHAVLDEELSKAKRDLLLKNEEIDEVVKINNQLQEQLEPNNAETPN